MLPYRQSTILDESLKNALVLCDRVILVVGHRADELISRYAKEVILTYDADEAGQKALQKAMTLFDQTDVKVRIPALVGGKDPDEVLRELGAAALRAQLAVLGGAK